MKKYTTLLLAAALMITLSACSSSKGSSADTSASTEPTGTPASTEQAEEEEADNTPASTETADSGETQTEAAAADWSVSNDYYSVEVTDVEWDETQVYLKLTYTNNDTDKADFRMDHVTVNNCIWRGSGIYKAVDAGAAVTTEVTLRQDSNNIFDSFTVYDFAQPDEITFYTDIETEGSDSSKNLKDVFSIYATGLNEDAVVYPDYTAADSDIVVIDDDDFKLAIISVNPGSFTDCYYVYMQNDSDVYAKIAYTEDTYTENGESARDGFSWIALRPGERDCEIIYMKGDDVQSFGGTLQVTDFENDPWGDTILHSGEFSVNVADYDLD